MTDIWALLELLRSDNSRLFKEKTLKDNDSALLQRVVLYTMNPYKQFYVRKIPAYTPHETGLITLNEALDRLDRLSSREFTGNAAQNWLKTTLEDLNKNDGLVIERIIGKDLKCGVQSGTADRVWPKLVPSYNIQLAVSDSSGKLFAAALKKDGYLWAEPKIDGLRVNIWIQDGTVTYMSRNGKEFETFDHMTAGLLATYPNNVILDGEGKSATFQDSMSAITKSRGKENKAIFVTLFDMVTIEEFYADKPTTRTYEERRAELVSFAAPEFVVYGEPVKVTSLTEGKHAYDAFKANGHEGAIFKVPSGTYDFKRNDNWIKMKPVETVDVEIIGYELGNGRNAARLGNFIYLYNGKRGSCGTGISDQQRDEFWAIRDELIGTQFEMEFMELTDENDEGGGGVPRHPVFIRLRSFKGEKA